MNVGERVLEAFGVSPFGMFSLRVLIVHQTLVVEFGWNETQECLWNSRIRVAPGFHSVTQGRGGIVPGGFRGADRHLWITVEHFFIVQKERTRSTSRGRWRATRTQWSQRQPGDWLMWLLNLLGVSVTAAVILYLICIYYTFITRNALQRKSNLKGLFLVVHAVLGLHVVHYPNL